MNSAMRRTAAEHDSTAGYDGTKEAGEYINKEKSY
jgi:hypothetical protein